MDAILSDEIKITLMSFYLITRPLQNFVKDVFIQMGCPSNEAEEAAEVLVNADLRGVDSSRCCLVYMDISDFGKKVE